MGVVLYSVGHSNATIQTLSGLLQGAGIDCLVDVRSQPYSRYSPHFSKNSLRESLEKLDIRYHYKGDRLGGRPVDREFYLESGRVDYELLATARFFESAIDELIDLGRNHQAAFLCSEADFSKCHRYHLITRALVDRGAQVMHLLHSGEVVASDPAEFQNPQPSLF